MASAYMVGTSTNPIDVVTSKTVETKVSQTVSNPKKVKTVEERVSEYFKDSPIMTKVAWCESRNRQFDKDGSVFRGKVNNDDVGVMQVNTYYHESTAKKMGLDLMTLEGNLAYAKYLYEREGTTPWNSSKPCWGKNLEVAAK
jgi:hypothetical protein